MVKLKDDDPVRIVVFIKYGNFINLPSSRGQASHLMRLWWSWYQAVREGILKDGEKELSAAQAQHSLSTGAWAENASYTPNKSWEKGDPTWCRSVIPWANIIAMYVTEVDTKSAAERMVEVLEKQVGEGEEWKHNDEEGDL